MCYNYQIRVKCCDDYSHCIKTTPSQPATTSAFITTTAPVTTGPHVTTTTSEIRTTEKISPSVPSTTEQPITSHPPTTISKISTSVPGTTQPHVTTPAPGVTTGKVSTSVPSTTEHPTSSPHPATTTSLATSSVPGTTQVHVTTPAPAVTTGKVSTSVPSTTEPPLTLSPPVTTISQVSTTVQPATSAIPATTGAHVTTGKVSTSPSGTTAEEITTAHPATTTQQITTIPQGTTAAPVTTSLPGKTTVTVPSSTVCQPKCRWTTWFDENFPSSEIESGDIETFDKIIASGKTICNRPEDIQDIECRADVYPDVSISEIGQIVKCDVRSGLVCENEDQEGEFKMCYNYQIRVKCCDDYSHCIKTTPSQPATTSAFITTTAPVTTGPHVTTTTSEIRTTEKISPSAPSTTEQPITSHPPTTISKITTSVPGTTQPHVTTPASGVTTGKVSTSAPSTTEQPTSSPHPATTTSLATTSVPGTTQVHVTTPAPAVTTGKVSTSVPSTTEPPLTLSPPVTTISQVSTTVQPASSAIPATTGAHVTTGKVSTSPSGTTAEEITTAQPATTTQQITTIQQGTTAAPGTTGAYMTSSPGTTVSTITVTPLQVTTSFETTTERIITPMTSFATTTPCFCQFNNTIYSPGETIYNKTDSAGCVFFAICGKTCQPERFQGGCPPTVVPSISTSAGTTSSVPTPAPSSAPTVISTSVSSSTIPPTSRASSTFIPPTTSIPTDGCFNVEPPRMVNETWEFTRCANATCLGNNYTVITSVQCATVENITCESGLKPKKIYDDDGCCYHFECESCIGPDGKSRMPGETWKSNCQECSCDMSTVTVKCKPIECKQQQQETCEKEGFELVSELTPDDPCCSELVCRCNPRLCNNTVRKCDPGYTLTSVLSVGDCCATLICVPDNVCVVNSTVYQPGVSIPTSKESCEKCGCSYEMDPKTKLNLVTCKLITCETECPLGFEYRMKAGQCCGECVQVACVMKLEDNTTQVIQPGGSWHAPDTNCSSYSCDNVEDQLVLVSKKRVCTFIEPKDCEFGIIVMSEDGCCEICIPEQVACRVEKSSTVLKHGECVATVDLAFCEGVCNSSSKYSDVTSMMEKECTCCQELKISKREVQLTCPDGSSIGYSYIYVDECGCKGTVCVPEEGTQKSSQQSDQQGMIRRRRSSRWMKK
ncbi:mucin-2 [Microcaecilia unicolor]|uniref:Mucin-2-like n=1 Tax=Microcaecilia unicolor TaxID=1415580 RepID=A0A6P7Y6E2_9AMPH|nr:mucin-2-like [Microcaecilia unicolor]